VLVTGTATRGVLPITVTERGEIESSKSSDARCEVEGEQIKIVSILPEGTRVTKNQEVVKFDSEKLQRSFAEQEIKWKQAVGKAGAARGELEVGDRTRRQSSALLMSGITASLMITSGDCAEAIFSPVSPSDAVTTSKPNWRNNAVIGSRSIGEKS